MDTDVMVESISSTKIKISKPSVEESFITISFAGGVAVDDDNQVILEIKGNADSSDRISFQRILYSFIQKGSGDEIKIYNPKISILMNAEGTNNNLIVSLDSTICGKILLLQSEAAVKLKDSIVDGKGSSNALTCYNSKMETSTVFGSVNLFKLDYCSNVMFTDIVTVEHIQKGCVRFCYVPENSRTPRRYHCQPEYFNAIKSSLKYEEGDLLLNLVPIFTSKIYGDPGYGQLHRNISYPIFEGGDNGSEIGVFNHLYQPQRIKNLKSSLDEYLRFGLEAGFFLVT